jgi:ribosomal protein S18 acetylase RimI-like enzyme
MNIRRAVLSDLSDLVLLHREVQMMHAHALPDRFREDVTDEALGEVIRGTIESPSSCLLVAENGTVAGFLSAEFRDRPEIWCAEARRSIYLNSIVVAFEFRRRGVACALLEALRTVAEQEKVAGMELDVWRFNTEAREAFQKLEFVSLWERMVFAPAAKDPSDSFPANSNPE